MLEAFTEWGKTIGSSAATGALVGGLANFWLTGYRDKKKRKQEFRTAALDAAATLERFTFDCKRKVEDADEAEMSLLQNNEHEGVYRLRLPHFEPHVQLSSNALGPDITSSLMDMENEVEASHNYVSVNEGYILDRCHTVAGEAAKLGVMAWSLAQDLRQKAELPAPKISEHYNGARDSLQQIVDQRASVHPRSPAPPPL